MKTKLVIFAVISFLIVSCTGNKYIERTTPWESLVSFLDFQPYLSKGFVFSTGDINQNYVPIGVIYHVTEPDIIKIYKPSYNIKTTNAMIESGEIIVEKDEAYIFSKAIPNQKSNINDILQKVYEYSISKNANGLINLKYSKNENEVIEISGTLIKIQK